jgi:hypothetical protein
LRPTLHEQNVQKTLKAQGTKKEKEKGPIMVINHPNYKGGSTKTTPPKKRELCSTVNAR